MPPSDMDFTVGSTSEETGLPWNQQLLLDTQRPEDTVAPQAPVSPVVRDAALRRIAAVGNDLAKVINLVSSTVRSQRASQDASDRADTALALLESRYGMQTSEALGAAAIRQARAMLAEARTQDDLASAAVFLRRAQAVQQARQLSESSPHASSDLLPLALGAGALLVAAYYWHRSTRRPRLR